MARPTAIAIAQGDAQCSVSETSNLETTADTDSGACTYSRGVWSPLSVRPWWRVSRVRAAGAEVVNTLGLEGRLELDVDVAGVAELAV